jgi:hypothetical protein
MANSKLIVRSNPVSGDLPILLVDNGDGTYSVATTPDPHAARKTLLSICTTEDSSGNTAIVAAPAAGQSHYVVAFVIQNEAATANTILLSDGTTAVWRCFAQNQGDGLAMVFPAGREWKVGDTKAITINLSAATVCGYSIMYYTA